MKTKTIANTKRGVMRDRMTRQILARLTRLEDIVSGGSLSLRDQLRSFPGGISRLSEASGVHRATLYEFADGKHVSFPFQIAAHVSHAFQAAGKGDVVTELSLRSAWERERRGAKAAV